MAHPPAQPSGAEATRALSSQDSEQSPQKEDGDLPVEYLNRRAYSLIAEARKRQRESHGNKMASVLDEPSEFFKRIIRKQNRRTNGEESGSLELLHCTAEQSKSTASELSLEELDELANRVSQQVNVIITEHDDETIEQQSAKTICSLFDDAHDEKVRLKESSRRTMMMTSTAERKARRAMFASQLAELQKLGYRYFDMLDGLQQAVSEKHSSIVDRLESYKSLRSELKSFNPNMRGPVEFMNLQRNNVTQLRRNLDTLAHCKRLEKEEAVPNGRKSTGSLNMERGKKRLRCKVEEDDEEEFRKVKIERKG